MISLYTYMVQMVLLVELIVTNVEHIIVDMLTVDIKIYVYQLFKDRMEDGLVQNMNGNQQQFVV